MDHFTQILSGLSEGAQLEVLVLFQLDENSTVNSGAYSSQRKTPLSWEDWNILVTKWAFI